MRALSPAEFRVLSNLDPAGGSGEIIDTPDGDFPVMVRLYDAGLVGIDPEDCACITTRGEIALRVHRKALAAGLVLA